MPEAVGDGWILFPDMPGALTVDVREVGSRLERDIGVAGESAVYMTTVRLLATAGANPDISSAVVHDALWAWATPEIGLEHVRVAFQPGRIGIAMFCISTGQHQASSSAIRACELACKHSPVLRGWQVSRLA
jgi:hypothetical protein